MGNRALLMPLSAFHQCFAISEPDHLDFFDEIAISCCIRRTSDPLVIWQRGTCLSLIDAGLMDASAKKHGDGMNAPMPAPMTLGGGSQG